MKWKKRSSLSNFDQDLGLNPSKEFAAALRRNKRTVFLKMRRMSEVRTD